eukprot:1796318-Pyramimonas_sp.AAC.1
MQRCYGNALVRPSTCTPSAHGSSSTWSHTSESIGTPRHHHEIETCGGQLRAFAQGHVQQRYDINSFGCARCPMLLARVTACAVIQSFGRRCVRAVRCNAVPRMAVAVAVDWRCVGGCCLA